MARAATPLRAVGAVRLVAHRGARRARGRRHPVRDGRLADAARVSSARPRPGTRRTRALDAKVWESLHISSVFERAGEFDLIHNSFDFLPLTYSGLVDTPVVTTIHGFSSERIVPVFQKYNDSRLLRRDQRRRQAREAGLHRDDPPRHRHDRVRARHGRRRLSPVLRPNPPRQGDCRGDRRRRAGRHPADPRRDRSGPGVLRPPRGPEDRRLERHLRRAGLGGRPERAARRGPGAPAPDQLRRAVRLQRDRGDGLRDAGDRDGARIDAGDRRARDERLSRHDAGGSAGGCGRPRAISTEAPCGARSSSASGSTGWWTSTSTSTGGSSRRGENDRFVRLEGSVPGPAVSPAPGRDLDVPAVGSGNIPHAAIAEVHSDAASVALP